MWTAIISLLSGGLLTGGILWIRQFFKNQSEVTQLKDIAVVADERLQKADEQSTLDRYKRNQELINEASKILTNNDTSAALALLRRKFPKSGSPTTSS